MSTSRNSVGRRSVLLTLLAMLLGGMWMLPGSVAAQPETEIYNFLQINVAEADGDDVTFLPGQELCLAVTVSPPLTPGGTPWITHCYSALPAQTLHANNLATPFLRSSSYSIAVASNNTGCTVTAPAMTPANYGAGSGWYAIFNVVADCPDTPVPSTQTPVPPVATSTVVPTATTVPTSTSVPPTSTVVPTATLVPAESYDLLVLWFNPVGSTPPVLTGAVCALIVDSPPSADSTFYEFCSTNSSTNAGFSPLPDESFPTGSTYTATITSNASGCLVTTAPLREGRGDSGFLGIIDVMIDCEAAPASTATSTPTATTTAVSTATPPVTATATAPLEATATSSPSSTEPSSPTVTTVSTEPGTMTIEPTATTAPVRTETAPTLTATTSGSGPVTSLPTTGAGPLDVGMAEAMLLVGGLILVAAALSMYWFRGKP